MKDQTRLMFTRPLAMGIGVAVALELVNFILFALLPGGSEHLMAQFIWMVGIGGIGMGAVLGVFLDVIVVGRLAGKEAIQTTTLVSVITLGIVAKLMTLNMLPLAGNFQLLEWSTAYFVTGTLMAAAAGAVLGWLLFTDKGETYLTKYGW